MMVKDHSNEDDDDDDDDIDNDNTNASFRIVTFRQKPLYMQ